MRQYTNGFSSKKASPGYIARARSIYNKLCSELSDNHGRLGYAAIESDSGEYFINANKKSRSEGTCNKISRTVNLYF